MVDPIIVNRAANGPPEGPKPDVSPIAAVWGGIEAIARRLVALEARPIAREVDPNIIRQIAAEEVAKAIAALPAPAPAQRKRRTVVTKHDSEGRIQEFIQEDI